MTPTSAHNGEKSPGSTDSVPTAAAAATREVARAENHAPLAKKTRGYMQILSLTSVGLEMGIAVLIGLLGGQWLDRRYDVAPLFLLLGLFAGCGAAAKAVWDAVKKADRMVDDPAPPASKDVP